jgi:type II secretory pathway pseudopilin PulG
LLIELVVTLALIAVLGVAVTAMLMAAANAQVQAGNNTVAVNLAREKMEEAVALGVYRVGCEESLEVEGFPRFRRGVDVSVPSWMVDEVELREVTVTVRWLDREAWREVKLVTYVFGR